MRSSFATCLIAPVLLGLACSSGPQPVPAQPSEPAADANPGEFSADRAWGHLEALAAIGPRAVGTPGAERARSYLSGELHKLGLEVNEWSANVRFTGEDGPEPLELASLEATIPGASRDLLVLAAPFDSAYQAGFEYIGVNDGASGAAVLLEVARVLIRAKLPYSVRLLFLDGEAPLGRGAEEDVGTRHLGSVSAAGRMATSGELPRVRLLLYLNRVSDADLQIPRDRFSHRTYRDAIWRTAAELGHADVFTLQSDFEAPLAGHRAFHEVGMRRTVAIIDPRFGSGELPDAGEHAEDDTLERSSSSSLALVGEVVIASLEEISAWLQKIDRFSKAPTLPEPEPAPEAETKALPAADPAAETKAPPPADPAAETKAPPAADPEAETESAPDAAPTPEVEAAP